MKFIESDGGTINSRYLKSFKRHENTIYLMVGDSVNSRKWSEDFPNEEKAKERYKELKSILEAVSK